MLTNNIKQNIALISISGENVETFVASHINNLEGNIFFYHGGYLPHYLEGHGRLYSKYNYLKERIKIIFKRNDKFSFEEKYIMNSFKKNKINIVFAEYGLTGASIVNVCKKLKIPLITTFLGFDISKHSILKEFKLKYKSLFQYGDKMIVVSKHMTSKLMELGCSEDKIIWSPCPPNSENFKVKNNNSKNRFFMMGRFANKKAPYYSILAFKKVIETHPNSELLIAGSGELFEACVNLIKHYKLDDSIKLIGKITPETAREIFSTSLCFIQHSINSANGDSEGTPVAILEALACGVPVVSTLHAGIPDVVQNNQSGFLVEEHQVLEMAEKMIFLIDNKERAKQMGQNGKTFIKNNFHSDIHFNILNSLIKDLTTRKL